MTHAERSVLHASLRRPDLPPGFDRWHISLSPGDARPAEPGEWDGALVMVERGELEVECAAGGRRRFAQGDLLALDWLPVRTLSNHGTEPVELLAVRQRDSSRP